MVKKRTVYTKAAQGLGILNSVHQTITSVVKSKYPITECLGILKSMWAKPDYTELCISSRAWYKLVAFINLVGDYEISGFGRIQRLKCNDGVDRDIVTDFDIIKQEVKSAYVESDEDAILAFLMKLPADQRNEWTLDWHSHVNMGTTPSGTDWTNYSDMLKARLGKQFPIMIVNKQGSITSYQIINDSRHEPIQVSVFQQQLPDAEIEELYNECKAKVEELCTRPTVTTTSSVGFARQNDTWAGRQGYDYDYDYYDSYGKRWWEEDDEEVQAAKKKGYVFDEEVPDEVQTLVEDYSMCCAECGKPLNPQNLEEVNMGVCSECFNNALK